MKSFMISGDRSGAGKTSITLAVSSILSEKSKVQTYKTAMDYIDASYLSGVTGRPAYNLDSFVQSADEMKGLFTYGSIDADYGVVEGVRGLFEGYSAFSDIGSTASIAKIIKMPVILVINARSITRSAAAIVKGFQVFDEDVNIAGVILNNTGPGKHVKKASDAIEYYCKVPVLGAVPRSDDMALSMRHLGLIPFREEEGNSEFLSRIEKITSHVREHIDIDKVKEIALETAPEKNSVYQKLAYRPSKKGKIAIAYDEAFNFYYGELTPLIESMGYEPIFFSPIHDTLPDADGYIFGGGYPELFAEKLSENTSMRESVKEAAENGTPIYAECGGLLYLTDSISVKAGWRGVGKDEKYEMCRVFSAKSVIPEKKVLGYVCGKAEIENKTYDFKGHEFHYSAVIPKSSPQYAFTLSRGTGIAEGRDGIKHKRCIGSFTHLMPVSSYGILSSALCADKKR